MVAEPTYEVVWPLGKSVYETIPLAARAPNLDGKTVCELWDWRFRGREVFPIIRESLLKHYPGIKIIDYDSFGNTHGPNERDVVRAIPDQLRQRGCDAVISGIGA
ncbi:MAG: hypothetical protein HYX92_03195 [Chloroflexi bacterium]|nr:hypothetical protein [Chloroflexota bacterium]